MSILNRKNIAAIFAGIALLSASSLGGVNALADNGGTTPTTNGASKNAIGQIDNGGKATANQNMTNATTTDSKSVSGRSDAHINVVNGYLVLETVPSLGFQDVTGQQGNTKSNKVQDHNTVLTSDSFFKGSEKPTDLYVLDARNGESLNGYSVDAKLGNFGTYQNGSTNTPDPSTVKTSDGNDVDQLKSPFTLNLSGSFDQAPTDGSSQVADNASLTSNNNSKTVLLNNDTKASGATKVKFDDNSSNGGGQTTLEVPTNVAAGQYAAPITWTLSAGTDGKTLN